MPLPHQMSAQLGKVAFLEFGEAMKQRLAGDQAEHGVSQELEHFVIATRRLLDDPLPDEPLPAPSASTSRACELWVRACSSSSRRWKWCPRLSSSAMISRDFITMRGAMTNAAI